MLNKGFVIGGLLASVCIGTTYAQEDAGRDAATEHTWTIPANEEIRKLLAERMEHNGVGIVVGIIEPAGQRVVAYGKSGTRRPLDGDTIFQIGSVTKTFTTLLLADMVQRGEVKLDDPAAKYVPPGVSMPERGRPITLLDLATHMSGLPSMPANFPLEGKPTPYEAYTVEELHQFLSSYELTREPGVKWQYSNLGVALLGRLLAYRMGMEYEALLKERVLNPLALHSTAIRLTRGQSRRLAPGHDRDLQLVAPWEMRTLPASGSLRSTTNDLLNFIGAYIRHDSSLNAAMAYQLSIRQSADSRVQALGWSIRKIEGIEIVGHDGGKEGYRSGVVFDPKTRTGVVVLANSRSDDTPMALAVHLLTGRPLQAAPSAPERKRIALDRKVLNTYAGRYRSTPDTILTVVRRDNHLIVEVEGEGIAEFYAAGSRVFFMNTGKDEIAFQADASSRITGLIYYGGGKNSGKGRLLTRVDAASVGANVEAP